MKTSVQFRRVVAVIGLLLLVAALVGGPTGISTVMADAGGTGHPIVPPDTTVDSSQPTDEVGTWTDVGLYLSTLSSMLL